MIVEELRVRAALSVEDGDIMHEAAARIEACLEAIDLAIGEQDNIEKVIDRVKAARYALLAARPSPFMRT